MDIKFLYVRVYCMEIKLLYLGLGVYCMEIKFLYLGLGIILYGDKVSLFRTGNNIVWRLSCYI